MVDRIHMSLNAKFLGSNRQLQAVAQIESGAVVDVVPESWVSMIDEE
jgi:hypothetical protein